VLNAPNWYSDSAVLLDYGFAVLAATPVDPGAEVLAISKRDTVAWLLANPEVAPPVPDEPALAQGGGAPRENPQPQLAAPAEPRETGVGKKTEATTVTVASGNMEAATLPMLLVFGLIALSSCFLLARLWKSSRGGTGLLSAHFATFGTNTTRSHPEADVEVVAKRPPRVWVLNWRTRRPVETAPPRVLPQAGTRRRDPNLLVESETSATHIQRAVELSAQGRQGSGMSEFVMALRGGAEIDIAELAEHHVLSSGAFLALARAQVAVGRRDEARRTLLHGVLVLPNERVLRLALYQLHPEN
jgi:hypothetical protein